MSIRVEGATDAKKGKKRSEGEREEEAVGERQGEGEGREVRRGHKTPDPREGSDG